MKFKNIAPIIVLGILLANFYPCLQSKKVHVYLLTTARTEFEQKFLSHVNNNRFFNAFQFLPGISPHGEIYSKLKKIASKTKTKKIVLASFNYDEDYPPTKNSHLKKTEQCNKGLEATSFYEQIQKKISNYALMLANKIIQNFKTNKNDQYLLCYTNIHTQEAAQLLCQMVDSTGYIKKEKTCTPKKLFYWPENTYNLPDELTKKIFYLDLCNQNAKKLKGKEIAKEIIKEALSLEIKNQDPMNTK